ncbi:hypothetical protein HDA40_002098 [Hamadaea flava]|uniref:DUF5956 family protein n=1 Tax=Hamadaea flava TaxID=1742688 RepID=A0ABV8LK65_9ACTN|nr:DUF5956 family protein [Hamadaea flava]MCP2323591.1 hypothetical protein [Hamadaea flava]
MATAAPLSSWDNLNQLASEPIGQSDVIELPDSGWGAIIAWLSPRDRVARLLDDRVHTTWVRIESNAGPSQFHERRSQAEQDALDHDVDGYLADASVPPRPRGYRWFLRLPPDLDGNAFWARVHSAMDEAQPTPVHPGDVKQVLQHVFASIFPAE